MYIYDISKKVRRQALAIYLFVSMPQFEILSIIITLSQYKVVLLESKELFKSKKKLGNSDPIANYITTRPRSI